VGEHELTRRELLARGTGAAVLSGVALAGGLSLRDAGRGAGASDASPESFTPKDYFSGVEFPLDHPRISVAVGTDESHIERMVRESVAGLDPARGMRRFIAPGDRVLIKPNVGFDRPPHLGATTHPEVLRWLIRLSVEAGASEVVVVDHPIESPDACFSRSGIRAVAVAEGARIQWPGRGDFAPVMLNERTADAAGGQILDRWPVFHRPLARADKLIGVAPVKDHNLCGASMVLKNWYGLLGGRRNLLHQAIHETISDLALMMSPTLVVADATRVMMRSGPTGGRVTDVEPGGVMGRPVIVASVDPVACDAWCCRHLLGRDPESLSYLAMAGRKLAADVAAGRRTFGQHDWRVYERQGRIVTTRM
jgi:uncharacterized protein (DUF362 family)